MNSPIKVPQPCHQSWEAMSPASGGRHCGACEKTVVDFTSWDTADILSYLYENGSACGRFRTAQPKEPADQSVEVVISTIAGSRYSYFQKLAMIFLLAFGALISGCQSDTTDQHAANDSSYSDTTSRSSLLSMRADSPVSRYLPEVRIPNRQASKKQQTPVRRNPKDEDILGAPTDPGMTMGIMVGEAPAPPVQPEEQSEAVPK